jgi:ribose-phosphate pyrophosphokinase
MTSIIFTVDNRPEFVESIYNNYKQIAEDAGGTSTDLKIGKLEIDQFSDGEYSPRFLDSVRGERVYLVGSTRTSDDIIKMCLCIDAAKRASASEIVVVIPYYGYARQDRKGGQRSAIGAKVMANMLIANGVTRIICADLHSEQIEGFFDVPLDHVTSESIFMDSFITGSRSENGEWVKYPGAISEGTVFVSPDAGGMKRVNKYWRYLADIANITTANIDKRRDKPNSIDKMSLVGDVDGKDVVIIDDMLDTANTVIKAAQLLKEHGARNVDVFATHPILSGDAIERIHRSVINKVHVANTINTLHLRKTQRDFLIKEGVALENYKIEIVDCSKPFAQFLYSINNNLTTENYRN